MMGTMISAATGSAQYSPHTAFRSKPPSKIAERYVQNSVCLASAFIAWPIFGVRDQPALHQIGVNVLELLFEFLGTAHG